MECSSYSRNTCRLCGSSDVSVFLPLAASPIADAYVPKEKLEQSQPLFPMDVWICLNCGHVQLLDVVNPDHIYREYLYITHSSPGLVDYYREYAHQMAAFASLAKSDLVIDIGSNDGALLSAFQRLGMRVLGFSCLSNKNLPDCMAPAPLEEIIAVAGRAGAKLDRLLRALVTKL